MTPEVRGKKHLVFALGTDRYASALGEVIEIADVPQATWVPSTPPWIRGAANHRGEVLAIVDLRFFLDLAPASAQGRMLIAGGATPGQRAGLLVDSIHGITHVTEEDLTSKPSGPLRIQPFVRGVGTDAGQPLLVLNIEELVSSRDLRSPELPTLPL